MTTLIHDIINLIRNGWRPYTGLVAPQVYERQQCQIASRKGGRRPYWFVREDIFVCVGCGRRCSLSRPTGFVIPLPIKYQTMPPDQPYSLSPQEMVARHDLLNVRQAAYCLNVSERTIYDYIAEGKLIRLREKPVRVRAKEVRELRNDFDE